MKIVDISYSYNIVRDYGLLIVNYLDAPLMQVKLHSVLSDDPSWISVWLRPITKAKNKDLVYTSNKLFESDDMIDIPTWLSFLDGNYLVETVDDAIRRYEFTAATAEVLPSLYSFYHGIRVTDYFTFFISNIGSGGEIAATNFSMTIGDRTIYTSPNTKSKAFLGVDEELDDPVNHPEHYRGENGIECIDGIEASMTDEEYKGYLKGNAMKYLWRYQRKGKPVEDLNKSIWYVTKLTDFINEQKEASDD